ncbi:MAG: FG-GAP-like repeat-containing protein [bacterium]
MNNYDLKTYGTITMGDVNGDKFPDMLLPNYDYQIPGQNNYALSGYSVFLAKLESDGKWLGKFESDPVSTITLQSPVLQIQAATETNKDDEFLSTNNSGLLVDVTGDGLLDMIVPENTGFTVFPNSGNGQFAQGAGVFVASTTGYPAANLQAGDLNDDGKIDLVSSPNAPSTALWADNPTNPYKKIWSANTAPVSIYLNTSTSTSSVSFNVNQYAGLGSGNDYNGALALADFNQDGILDLAFASANYQSTNLAVATGDGNGGFGNYILFTGYSNQVVKYYPNETRLISSIGVGDYNNDGQLDITTSAFPNFAGDDRDSQCNEGVVGALLNNTFTNPAVSPATLSVGKAGMPYSQQLGHTGGNPALPYNYALNAHSSALPAGLSLSPSGLISGTPQRSGNFEILVDITQPSGMKGSSFLNLSIEAGTPAAILPGILPNAVAGVSYYQPLANQAGPATWVITGGKLPPGLTLSPNGVISGTPTGIGQYPFQLTSAGSGFQSSITYNMIVQGAAAPIVTGLKRYGYHAQSTTLVASFSQPMLPASANDVANYVLVSAGADGRFGTRDDKNIPLASASYNTASNSVTLRLVQKNIPLRHVYALSINGTPTAGLQNTGGVFLGGQGVGAPGTNYVQIFSGKILAGPNNLMKTTKRTRG